MSVCESAEGEAVAVTVTAAVAVAIEAAVVVVAMSVVVFTVAVICMQGASTSQCVRDVCCGVAHTNTLDFASASCLATGLSTPVALCVWLASLSSQDEGTPSGMLGAAQVY